MAEGRSRQNGLSVPSTRENDQERQGEYPAGNPEARDSTLNEDNGAQTEQGHVKSASSESEEEMDDMAYDDMQRFEMSFKDITRRYRLISRIGEGTFSTVYKAEDLHYDRYRNDWDIEADRNKITSPQSKKQRAIQKKPHYVAIKKIYVTSSPVRIMNELDLLHDLRNCSSICPLITAFRHSDQVIAVLPYFRHEDFRGYFRDMSIADVRSYFRSLFTALKHVHKHNILHRDIKPTNFLYDIRHKRGVLVDFGLAERQGSDNGGPCVCQLGQRELRHRIDHSYSATHPGVKGYPKEDQRPSKRANRAGTRGFRAPEVLFKCTAQTPKIDIWSVGIILLTMLSRRFPFFHSTDDIDAVIELTTVFGRRNMRQCALLHGQIFDINIPTVTENGFSLEKIILWSNNQPTKGPNGEKARVSQEQQDAVVFLEKCLALDPRQRISAAAALDDPFLAGYLDIGSEDEMDVLSMSS